ncbi:PepSY-associated TM helix domain-containing protein, partial [Erythrobacter sp.]|uniref:PepSY-associated TM helix domain-containing protein n=1 Tax=Erythrobacter sp. TaxID=1042 RepID=UPI00311E47D2
HPPHVHEHGSKVSVASVIPPSKAIETAMTKLPDARLAWIETPPASGGTYRLRMQVPGDPSFRFPHSFVWVDGATGKALAVQDAQIADSGTTVNNWVHPLHDGSAGGLVGRILVALAGLFSVILFVTGWMRWRINCANASR